MKGFFEALSDGFTHITQISDPAFLQKLRSENVLVDSEGIFSFPFGEKHEYSLNVEPLQEEHTYRIVLYKNRVPLTEPLVIATLDKLEELVK